MPHASSTSTRTPSWRPVRGAPIATLLLAASLGLAGVSASFAAGGGGGGGGGSGGSGGSSGGSSGSGGSSSGASGGGGSGRTDLTTCKKGEMWSVWKRQCVPAQKGELSDPDMTEYAFALAKAERYDEALAMLDMLDNPNTPRALNYRGYATRKLGRTEEGISYYLKSVALDPHYAQVREYLGEAYVIQGKVDLAKDQLSVIKAICGGSECEEYEDLAAAIDGKPEL